MDTFLEAEKRTIMAKDNKNKQFTELSDEDLKQVTGGAGIDCSLPENKDNIGTVGKCCKFSNELIANVLNNL